MELLSLFGQLLTVSPQESWDLVSFPLLHIFLTHNERLINIFECIKEPLKLSPVHRTRPLQGMQLILLLLINASVLSPFASVLTYVYGSIVPCVKLCNFQDSVMKAVQHLPYPLWFLPLETQLMH